MEQLRNAALYEWRRRRGADHPISSRVADTIYSLVTSHRCVRMTHIWLKRAWVPVARFSSFDPLRLGLNIESAHGRSPPPISNALKATTEPVYREKWRVYCFPTSIRLNLKRGAIGGRKRKRAFATYAHDAPLGPEISFRCPSCSMRDLVRH